MDPLCINQALEILHNASVATVSASDFGWRKIYNARKHLEAQLVEYFAPEEEEVSA